MLDNILKKDCKILVKLQKQLVQRTTQQSNKEKQQ